jgi:hypothetical protein
VDGQSLALPPIGQFAPKASETDPVIMNNIDKIVFIACTP